MGVNMKKILVMMASIVFLSGCVSMDPNQWRFVGELVREGDWQVLYGNHWPNRYDKVLVVNCSREGQESATETNLVLAREDPVRPPDVYPSPPPPADKRVYEPIADLSVFGSRRILVVDSGWRLAARTTKGTARICVRLVESQPLNH